MKLPNFLCALKSRREPTSKATERRRFRPRLEMLEDRLAPAVFIVNTAVDENNGIGVGGVSLREAITAANAAAGADTINFAIGTGPQTINLVSALPTLTGTVTIAGNTQPGFTTVPLIELNGTGAGAGANGLVMKAAGSVVRSLVINRFQGNGILAFGSNGVVEGCYIGTNNTGATASANQFHGVLIAGAASNVRIGGTTTAARNIISGNSLSGVAILGLSTNNNKVQGNFIGTDVTGVNDLGNILDGVLISGGSKNNVIGGTVAATLNVISGNTSDGVEISGVGTTGNKVQGNHIGLRAGGAAGLGNSGDGVRVAEGASANFIGGSVSGADNVISSNTGSGVTLTDVGTSGNFVQGNFFGTNDGGFNLALGNGIGVLIAAGAKNNIIGGTVAGARNLINSSTTAGVRITGAGTTGNLLQGNIIGLRLDGSGTRSNFIGVEINAGATGNVVGGTVAGSRNIISGNTNSGVRISGVGTTTNLVQGNFIGTGLNGIVAGLGNGDGVLIDSGALNNTVGGTVVAARNIISGNTGDGVEINGASTTGNKVQGNYIGTDLTGTLDKGNALDGVKVTAGASNNTVGGTVAGARNIISGNNGFGVNIQLVGSANNLIQGNYIGTNAAGNLALANSFSGVMISNDADNNTVGGTVAGARNVISGNSNNGILMLSIGTTGNLVQGNFIGTNAAGTAALGNTNHGVQILNGPANNTIGGATAAARNIISGNNITGVLIDGNNTNGNQVKGNFIGLAMNGTSPLGNTSHGVFITNNAFGNAIGGIALGEGNAIAHNGGNGVLIGSDPDLSLNTQAGSFNSVQSNRIFNNAGLGIKLAANDDSVVNDANDVDSGPNNLLNTPVLTNAYLTSTNLLVMGTINTVANSVLRIEFFANPTTGSQGQTFLGFLNVSMGANTTVAFTKSLTVPASVLAGHKLTATITDELGNTSEFSIALTIE